MGLSLSKLDDIVTAVPSLQNIETPLRGTPVKIKTLQTPPATSMYGEPLMYKINDPRSPSKDRKPIMIPLEQKFNMEKEFSDDEIIYENERRSLTIDVEGTTMSFSDNEHDNNEPNDNLMIEDIGEQLGLHAHQGKEWHKPLKGISSHVDPLNYKNFNSYKFKIHSTPKNCHNPERGGVNRHYRRATFRPPVVRNLFQITKSKENGGDHN